MTAEVQERAGDLDRARQSLQRALDLADRSRWDGGYAEVSGLLAMVEDDPARLASSVAPGDGLMDLFLRRARGLVLAARRGGDGVGARTQELSADLARVELGAASEVGHWMARLGRLLEGRPERG